MQRLVLRETMSSDICKNLHRLRKFELQKSLEPLGRSSTAILQEEGEYTDSAQNFGFSLRCCLHPDLQYQTQVCATHLAKSIHPGASGRNASQYFGRFELIVTLKLLGRSRRPFRSRSQSLWGSLLTCTFVDAPKFIFPVCHRLGPETGENATEGNSLYCVLLTLGLDLQIPPLNTLVRYDHPFLRNESSTTKGKAH